MYYYFKEWDTYALHSYSKLKIIVKCVLHCV